MGKWLSEKQYLFTEGREGEELPMQNRLLMQKQKEYCVFEELRSDSWLKVEEE